MLHMMFIYDEFTGFFFPYNVSLIKISTSHRTKKLKSTFLVDDIENNLFDYI